MSYHLRHCLVLLWVLALGLVGLGAQPDQVPENSWPQWRGPLATGFSPTADPPVEWSESRNIRWKVALPGRGHSTPIVWGDRVFVTTAVPFGESFEPRHDQAPGAHHSQPVTQRHQFVVIALARNDGRILWKRTLQRELQHEGGHQTGSLASASPITDGQHLFVFFGSRGLYSLTLEGELLWQADLGEMRTLHAHGEGGSPALHGDTLVVNWDHEGQSFVVAFDKRSGRERWKVLRDEITSWATPIVVVQKGTAQVVVSGTGRIRAYDLASGRVIWECGGLSRNVVASPVASEGVVFAGSSYHTRALLAIRLDGAEGDITGTDQVLWTRRQGAPYVPSPLLYGDWLYSLRHYQGILSRVDVKTGLDQGGPFRLGPISNLYASPVGAAGRIYITDLRGTTVVVSHGEDEPRVLAVNRLDDSFSASAALAGQDLFLRGRTYLYRIAERWNEHRK